MNEKRKVLVWIFSPDDSGISRFLVFKTIIDRGGYWQPVTGSVESGETFEEGALRELKEETGFDGLGKLIDLDFIFHYSARGADVQEKCFGYFIQKLNKLPEPILEPKEHIEFKWVSEGEASRMIKYDSNRSALAKIALFSATS